MADKQDEGLKLLKEIRSINRMIDELQMQIDEIYSMLTSTTVKPKEVNVQSSGDCFTSTYGREISIFRKRRTT